MILELLIALLCGVTAGTLTGNCGEITAQEDCDSYTNSACYWDTDTCYDNNVLSSCSDLTRISSCNNVSGCGWIIHQPILSSSGGKVGGAMEFVASSYAVGDYLTITSYKGVLGTTDRSISMWFKTLNDVDFRDFEVLMDYGGWGDGIANLIYINGHKVWGDVFGPGASVGSTSDVDDDEWHHVVWVLEPIAEHMELWVDGVLESSADLSSIPDTPSGPNVQIGRCLPDRNRDEAYFNGSIDEVMIFNRSLSASEIQQLYEGSKLGGDKLENNNLNGGDSWKVGVTPFDYESQGDEVLSNDVTILGGTSNQPRFSSFSIAFGTTNFSALADLNSVPAAVLATSQGKIQWNSPIKANNQSFDDNVVIENRFVSVNSAALDSTLNVSANITMSGVNCNQYVIYYTPGTFALRESAISHGVVCPADVCTNIVCDNGRLNFTVSHFTGYAAGDNSNLMIWDSNDTGLVINATKDAVFYANYSNASSGESINGTNVSCKIKFKIISSTWTPEFNMTYNSGSKLYEYTTQFASGGNYAWNVSCNESSGSYSSLQANDTISIYQAPIGGNGGSGGSGGGGGGGPSINGTSSGNVSANLDSIVSITLPIDTVDFGNVTQNQTYVNLTGIQIQNDGTVRINLEVNGTELFKGESRTENDYLFKMAGAGEGNWLQGVFDVKSIIDWTPMTGLLRTALFNLDFLDAGDIAAMQFNVTVPIDEPAGAKESIITITASQA